MLGAIIGDIIGSPYEFDHNNIKTTDFPLFGSSSEFTDDTVMTVAVAEALMEGFGDKCKTRELLISKMRKFGRFYPNAGYGTRFMEWICRDDDEPYNSFGNGAAMRVSPVGWMFEDLEVVEEYAELTASVTHNHPEGIKGAKAVAAAIYLARYGQHRTDIKKYIEETYHYDLDRTLEDIRPTYHHVESCQESVPEAIIAFLESEDFEDAIRKAVSIGGDSDTIAAITGSIAQAYYKEIPLRIRIETKKRLSADIMSVLDKWDELMRVRRSELIYYLDAQIFIRNMHEGQTRADGSRYDTHPIAVAKILRKKFFPVKYQVAALLHDVLEDTKAKEEEVMNYCGSYHLQFDGQDVFKAVKLVTKEKDYDMAEYVARIMDDPIARNVKAADRLNNLMDATDRDVAFRKKYIKETKKWYMRFPGWEKEMAEAVKRLEDSIPEEERIAGEFEVQEADLSEADIKWRRKSRFQKLIEVAGDALTRLDKGIFLTTKSGEKRNFMTISWGAIGELWAKPMVVIMVRKSRYTHELLDQNKDFTLTFADLSLIENAKDVSGKKSGKDMDKFAALGLNTKAAKSVDAPVIDISTLQLECRVAYETDVDPEMLSEKDRVEFYSDGDMHTLYFAEIIEAYENI